MKQVFTFLLSIAAMAAIAQPTVNQKPTANADTHHEEYKTLLGAAGGGDTAAVHKFLKQGVNPSMADKEGNSPMLIASRMGYVDVVKLLIKYGAKVDEPRSPKGRTPLMAALAYSNGIEIAKVLVENGANVNARASDGTTPLIIASAGAKYNVVEYLIKKGADVKAKDNNGKTALTWAGEFDQNTFEKVKGCKDCIFSKPSTIKLLQEKMQ